MIFQMNQLIDTAVKEMQQEKARPDREKYREARAVAEKELLDTGYDKRYLKLFEDVACYVALYRLGFAATGYMLMGNPGCGKTEAAKRISAMLKIEFVTTAELLECFGTDDYYQMVKQANFFSGKPGDLIIDEIGTEPRPFVHYGTRYNVIADVLQMRYDAFKFHGARTIVTTNLKFEELDEAYGDRVGSRCWEMFKSKQYSSCDFRKTK